MERKQLLRDLIEIINSYKNDSGWTDLAIIGKPLSTKGINYKALGYLKLKDFIQDFPSNIEIKIDNSHQVPVLYARIINSSQEVIDLRPAVNPTGPIHQTKSLLGWAWMQDYRQTIIDLKNIALKERWYYKTQNPRFPFPILSKYLTYTFYRLASEKNKIVISGKYASFNTGLVDKRYEPIFALFEKNRMPNKQEWYFLNFCIPGEDRSGKLLTSNFNPLPKRAHYFDNTSEMIYDINASEPQLDWNHIILDNVSRLTFEFIVENCPENFELKDPALMTTIEKDNYFKSLAQAIESDSKTYRSIKNRFKDAVDLALKRVQWNYKTAIPMYYPKTNRLSLLLPLALLDDEIIDLALVVEKTQSGNYLGHTVLPLAWAYSNARLITRPDSDWLVAEEIGPQTENEENEEENDFD
ncbi:MAG TPA: DUF3825 domain-containing protein [Candidatus Cloacimonadota bacterium]|nr:DUF3825 domain-containing protein [Candidatus Cloacimonadota bacterium]